MIDSLPQQPNRVRLVLRPVGDLAQIRELASGLLPRVALAALLVGMPLLVLLDWVYDFGMIGFPFAKLTRALLLVVFGLYIVQTGINFGAYGFRFGRVLFAFLAINLVYTLLSHDILGNLYYTSRIAFWILGTVVAFRLARSGALSHSGLRWTIIATIALGAAFTVYFMMRPDIEAGQNASAYLLLWCLPILLMVKRTRLDNAFLALAVVAILLTVKRGAMIALGLSLVAYALTYLKIYGNARAFAKILGLFALLAAISVYALAHNWDAVEHRFSDTTGSGRDQMYPMLITHWAESGPLNLAFGFGINSVQSYTGLRYHGVEGSLGPYAHSDWLQLMHDFGLFGLGTLMCLHYQFLAMIWTYFRRRTSCTPSLAMAYVVLFLVNIYSGHLVAPTAIILGVLLGFAATRRKPGLAEVRRLCA